METVTSENIEKWRRAGKIAAEALRYGAKLIRKGASQKAVCDAVDQKIIDLGAKPGWPSQIGCNEVAAHYTPDPDDDSVFDDELVCLDVGTHIDGCIGDNALTVDLGGKYADLVKATENALDAAHKALGIGVKVKEVSAAIQDAIVSAGFAPVKNLSGHSISPYIIHDAPTIPNINTNLNIELVEGQVVAIEPFATTGAGLVDEAESANLFALWNKKPVRSQYAREIMQFAEQEYGRLPFTTRWLAKKFGAGKASFALRELQQVGALHRYPPLVEKNRGMVAVTEKTFLIGKKVEVLTE